MQKVSKTLVMVVLGIVVCHSQNLRAEESRVPSPEEFKKIIQQYNQNGKLPEIQREQNKGVDQFNRALALHTKKNASPGDLKEAAALYQAASDAGIVPAKTNLAMIYIDGKGGKKDIKKAVALLNSASKLNDSQADVLLARLYLNGTDVKPNISKGEALLNKAVKAGNQNAVKMLAEYKELKKKNELSKKEYDELVKKLMASKAASDARKITFPFGDGGRLEEIPVIPGYKFLKAPGQFNYQATPKAPPLPAVSEQNLPTKPRIPGEAAETAKPATEMKPEPKSAAQNQSTEQSKK